MRRRKGAQAHQSGDRGRIHQFHEFSQFFRRVGRDDAAACINERPLSFPDHLRRAANLAGMALGENLVARQMDGRDRRVVRLRLQHVLRNVDQHWARPPG